MCQKQACSYCDPVTSYAPYRLSEDGFDPTLMDTALATAREYCLGKCGLDDFEAYRGLLAGLMDLPETAIVPMRELLAADEGRRVIGLRYDVDLDVATAIRMARHNARYGICGSFYLLPAAAYYGNMTPGGFIRNPRLSEWIVALIVAGCEIGLHIDPLGLYVRHGVDGAQGLCDELQWLRSQGARIDGTVSHNSGPVYGAEGFEIFKGRAVWGRTSVACEGRVLPLAVLDEAELGLSYEGNYPMPVSARPTAEAQAWLSGAPADAVANEQWMRTYLLDNPHFRREPEGLAWHRGGGKWALGARRAAGQTVWQWQLSPDELLAHLAQMPVGTRTVVVMHPVRFSGDTMRSGAAGINK